MSIYPESSSSLDQYPHSALPPPSVRQMTLILSLMFATVLIACLPTTLSLHNKWFMGDAGYSHGYLLLAICVYLIFDNKHRYRQAAGKPNWLYAPLLLGLSLGWMLLGLAGIQSLQQLILPFIFIITCALVLGFRFALAIAPAVGFILFGMPLWDYLIPLLQRLAIEASRFGLAVINVPAYIEGSNVSIPGGQFQIAGGCSGLRYVLVGLTLSALYGFLSYQSLWKKGALVAFALLMSVVSNWIRILIIIFAGYKSQMQHSLVHDHDDFGWVVFAFTLVPIFLLAKRLESGEKIKNDSSTTAFIATDESYYKLPYLAGILALALLMTGPLISKTIESQENEGNQQAFQFPLFLEDWSFMGQSSKDWQPNFKNAEKTVTAIYQKEQIRINISVFHYFNQTQGHELVYYSNNLVEPPWEKRLNVRAQLHKTSNTEYGQIVIYNKSTRRKEGQLLNNDKNVIFWFNVAGRNTTDKLWAKLYQLRGLLDSRKDAALISISSDCQSIDCSDSNTHLTAFGALFIPYIEKHFQ